MLRFFIFLFILCVNCLAYAEVKTNVTLNEFYQRTQSMQADFEQVISNSRGKIIESSKGLLIFSRPDKFIFEYTSPTEQKYISNSKTLWIYDIELEQVSIRSLDKGLGDSPALLLSSNSNVYQFYYVSDITMPSDIWNQNNKDKSREKPLHWVQLKSKKEDTSFERVLLGFEKHRLMKMKMYDSFGQVTELSFSNLQLNKTFSNKKFNFVVPEGVDVIGSVNAD